MYMPTPNGGDFMPPPAGTHLAICYRVIDLGTQLSEYQGETKSAHKIMIGWELCEERMEDNRPFSISQRYTFSSHEKSRLRQDLESWRGTRFHDSDFAGPPNGFHVRKVLGVPCLLNVVHNTRGGKTYANIAAISKPVKGMAVPALVNEKVYLSLDPGEFSQETWDKLSSGLRAIIEKSPEYQQLCRPKTEGHVDAPPPRRNDLDDEIPF